MDFKKELDKLLSTGLDETGSMNNEGLKSILKTGKVRADNDIKCQKLPQNASGWKWSRKERSNEGADVSHSGSDLIAAFNVDVVKKSLNSFDEILAEAARECGLPDLDDQIKHCPYPVARCDATYRESFANIASRIVSQIHDPSNTRVRREVAAREVKLTSLNEHKLKAQTTRHMWTALNAQPPDVDGICSHWVTERERNDFALEHVANVFEAFGQLKALSGNNVGVTDMRRKGSSKAREYAYTSLLNQICSPFAFTVLGCEHKQRLYPINDGLESTPVSAKPAMELTSTVQWPAVEVCTYHELLIAEVKAASSVACYENTLREHFAQLLVCLPTSLFANQWGELTQRLRNTDVETLQKINMSGSVTVEANDESEYCDEDEGEDSSDSDEEDCYIYPELRPSPAKHNYIFGLMMLKTKVYFTCLKMEVNHMQSVVRKARRGFSFSQINSDEETSVKGKTNKNSAEPTLNGTTAVDASVKELSVEQSVRSETSTEPSVKSTTSGEATVESTTLTEATVKDKMLAEPRGHLYVSTEPIDISTIKGIKQLMTYVGHICAYRTMELSLV